MAKDSRTTSKTVLPEDFIIKVNPHLNSKGKWNGGIELAIMPNLDNPLDDDDYYQVEHICKIVLLSGEKPEIKKKNLKQVILEKIT